MHTYSYVFRKSVARGKSASRPWRLRREHGALAFMEPYLGDVAPPIPARKANFAAWVKRAVKFAKDRHNMSVADIATKAGIGDQTIYRWMKAEGNKLPDPDAVLAFCDALDINPTDAFAILWPGKNDKPAEPLPFTGDEHYQVLMRKLNDPNVGEFEKEFIRETLRQLADRPAQPARVVKRAGRQAI